MKEALSAADVDGDEESSMKVRPDIEMSLMDRAKSSLRLEPDASGDDGREDMRVIFETSLIDLPDPSTDFGDSDDAEGDVIEDLGVERSVTCVPESGVEGREDNKCEDMRVIFETSRIDLRDPSRDADAAEGDVCEDLGVERSMTCAPEGGVEGREENTIRVSFEISLLSLCETFTVCGKVKATGNNLCGDS
jgi:hypothetical protein